MLECDNDFWALLGNNLFPFPVVVSFFETFGRGASREKHPT